MDYKVGDIIHCSTYGGSIRKVRVTVKEADIKNGQPGFIGEEVADGNTVWGYDSQVIRKAHPTGERW